MFENLFSIMPRYDDGFSAPGRLSLKNNLDLPDIFKKGFTPIDVSESDEKFIITADMPGFSKEDIKVEMKDGVIFIEANKETKEEENDDSGKFIRKERSFGRVMRSIHLGESASEENASAKLENGILTIEVKKKEPEVEEKTTIKIN